MINTILPYDFAQMEEIQKNGAIVDMSEIRFPGNRDASTINRTALIFLRNTGFKNIHLDFSKCTYEFKQSFLIDYISLDIQVQLNELIQTWLSILYRYHTTSDDIDMDESIMSIEEIDRFIESNHSMMDLLMSFINSLPIYALNYNRLLHDDGGLCEFMQHSDTTDIGPNIYHIISSNRFVHLDSIILDQPPIFFTNYFKASNLDLFQAISDHVGLGTMLAISHAQIQDIDSFEKEISEIIRKV